MCSVKDSAITLAPRPGDPPPTPSCAESELPADFKLFLPVQRTATLASGASHPVADPAQMGGGAAVDEGWDADQPPMPQES